jgi:hypothetical protein
VNGEVVCIVFIHHYWNSGSCAAVAHLNKGDRVWVEPSGQERIYSMRDTWFTGFLFNAD